MKWYFILLCTVFLFAETTVAGQNQLSNVFRKFRNDEGVKHINLSGDVTKMLAEKEKNLKSTVQEMHVYLFTGKSFINTNDIARVTKALREQKFELLLDTRDKKDKIKIHGVEKNGFMTDLYAEVISGKTKIYLILKGNILLSELSKMNFDFEGSGILKNIAIP
ncbi:MAG: DUF4252 domain-containing protein [Saprospiraceae bacterium]|nr:DUF4252 domain-containing protein [Saprospiraceae bacterium]